MNVKARFKAHFPVLAAVFLAACARQAEGERCDTANGNEDCESGLRCVSSSELSQIEEGALCCPPADQTPNVDACSADIPLFDDNPPDAAQDSTDDNPSDAGP